MDLLESFRGWYRLEDHLVLSHGKASSTEGRFLGHLRQFRAISDPLGGRFSFGMTTSLAHNALLLPMIGTWPSTEPWRHLIDNMYAFTPPSEEFIVLRKDPHFKEVVLDLLRGTSRG